MKIIFLTDTKIEEKRWKAYIKELFAPKRTAGFAIPVECVTYDDAYFQEKITNIREQWGPAVVVVSPVFMRNNRGIIAGIVSAILKRELPVVAPLGFDGLNSLLKNPSN